MCSIIAYLLIVSVQATVNELAANSTSNLEQTLNGLLDNMVNKMVNSALKMQSPDHGGLGDTTFAKLGSLLHSAAAQHLRLESPWPPTFLRFNQKGLLWPAGFGRNSGPLASVGAFHAISRAADFGQRLPAQDVDILMTAVSKNPIDKEAVLSACRALPLPADAVEQLVGDWKVGLGTSSLRDGPLPPPTKLRFLSFGALPDGEVSIIGGFNRVTGSAEEGGVYELFQVFTIPGHENVAAAMVLAGPWKKHESAELGRVAVHFQTVSIVPSSSDPDASIAMLNAAALHVRTVPVKAPPTYIDLKYIDGAMRVHQGASGALYLLSREHVPFNSG